MKCRSVSTQTVCCDNEESTKYSISSGPRILFGCQTGEVGAQAAQTDETYAAFSAKLSQRYADYKSLCDELVESSARQAFEPLVIGWHARPSLKFAGNPRPAHI